MPSWPIVWYYPEVFLGVVKNDVISRVISQPKLEDGIPEHEAEVLST
jgi:hypothetical protein